ncbi:hypothetical protein [Paenibacillus polymyxa]|uniref:hypothetical protein n=1 Tax=Paenibacillus polymyxa TaxID=1406 RepID=UPI0008BA8D8F|nr:hypothetical protein [Paenibacillus polymyxa]SEI75859.1 hypothetical protein SAMN04488600_101600 [Paenibacillus polymyxa]
MATIINYGATVRTPITNGLNIPIELGAKEIATTSVYIDPANPASYSNRVELKASIGVIGDFGLPKILVRILRAGHEIYYGLAGVESNFENYSIINVLTVDGAPLGVQNYQLAIENQSPGTTARVVGPLVFTATAIGG